jgi:hypothetical protein
MKKEHREKAFKARQEAKAKKIFTICGYEIWVDELNYTVVNNGNHYLSTLLLALKWISDDMRVKALKKVDSLEDAILAIKTSDIEILKALTNATAYLGHEFGRKTTLSQSNPK